jgi:hypothetical protein
MAKIWLWFWLTVAAVAGTIWFVMAVWVAYFLCQAWGLG